MGIIDRIVDIYIVIFWASIIIGNIVRIVLWIKCRKLVRCQNEKCFYKAYCKKYEVDMDKLREELISILESKDER